MKNLITFVVFALILVIGISVGSQNEQIVAVNYVLATTNMPLSGVIALAMLGGAILAVILLLPPLLRLRWQNARLRGKLSSLQNQQDKN